MYSNFNLVTNIVFPCQNKRYLCDNMVEADRKFLEHLKHNRICKFSKEISNSYTILKLALIIFFIAIINASLFAVIYK